MKNLTIVFSLLLSMLILSGCEEVPQSADLASQPESQIPPEWEPTAPEMDACLNTGPMGIYDNGSGIEFKFDETCRGETNICNIKFVYRLNSNPPVMNFRQVDVYVSEVDDDPACPTVGEYNCKYNAYGNSPVRLALDCFGESLDLPAIEWHGVPQ